MATISDDRCSDRALVAAYSSQHAIQERASSKRHGQGFESKKAPRPSTSRLASSHKEHPYCLERFVEEAPKKPRDETVLYLAYGSNFAASKFRGDRGIKPLSQINVQVPSLQLTFDLPGIPYKEPCFANTARRDPDNDPPAELDGPVDDEKTALLSRATRREKYRKNGWHKGLIGVVYEVTPEDYAHIIATEGGGAGYQDILVDCHPFVSSDPNAPVPQNPTLPPFKAHTLFAPAIPEGEPPQKGGHLQRPDPNYAQASARYLKLISDGAAECELPYEYQDFLLSIRPYKITTYKQRMGQAVLASTWMPFVLFMFTVGKLFVDKHGRLPEWFAKIMASIFKAVWISYDNFFKPVFGDGERTIGEDDEDARNTHDRQIAARQQRGHHDLEKGTR